MELGTRLRDTLRRARLSPRNFGGAIRIHYVTIYKELNGDGTRLPIHEQVINDSLTKVEKLIESGKLPFESKLGSKEKTDRLRDLLQSHD